MAPPLLLQQATAPPASLPASAPWWAWLVVAVLTLVVPAITTVLLERRKRASLVRLHKDVAVHGSTLTEHGAAIGALKQAVTEPPEKTDPSIAQGREHRIQQLEQRVALAERSIAEAVASVAKLNDWKDDHLAEERTRRDKARAAALAREAEDTKRHAELKSNVDRIATKLDNLLDMVGGFFGLGKALHGRSDRS